VLYGAMNKMIRAGLAGAAFFGTYVMSWLVLLLVPLGGFLWIGNLIALGVAIVVGRAVWRAEGSVPDSLIGSIGLGAAIFGSIGFAGGFFGPMIFAPEANQGPMLGIFITGPIGALLGAVAGLFYGLTELPRRSN
jgi:hypothetical protein